MIGWIICLCIGTVFGEPCADLSGVWRNELGSNMTLIHAGEKLSGRYSTSVESSKGAATYSTNITGAAVFVPSLGSLVAFNVIWNNGASLTAWVGQCMICDGQERIDTTWILQSRQTPINKWRKTLINQDTFWRIQNASVPQPPQVLTETEVDEGLKGVWSSEADESFELQNVFETGGLKGAFRSIPIVGSFARNETTLALGFAVANTYTTKGWTGHIYDGHVLETSWLTHSFSDSCERPRHFVGFGMSNYTRVASENP